ncbi:MAG: hypothetical protein Q4A07_12515, partial [Coriobacteriales bacterium]|nr:hypothetical protein [Coriobacteriales bacterium]
ARRRCAQLFMSMLSETARMFDHSDALNATGRRIVEFCTEPKGSREIMEHLGLRDIKSVRNQLKKLLELGRIARTIPDKPNSRNQKYITVR